MTAHRKYLIYADPFDPMVGGLVALYALCKRLSELGEEAVIWPSAKPPFRTVGASVFRDVARYAKHYRKFVRGVREVGCRIATWRDLGSAIVVYPEVVSGNPLGSKRVVRWFLHRPGFHSGEVNYGSNEIYFFYQDAFNDEGLNSDASNRLTVTYTHPAYRQTNFGERTGTCILLRKGASRAPAIDRTRQLVVDGLSHEQMARVFNEYEYLVSYDTYTMYSVFAAMCGCVPVIVPEQGMSREDWFSNPVDRLGLAYGWDDVAHARETRAALLERLRLKGVEEDDMISRFVEKTQRAFPIAASGPGERS
jgi:hypothetical protein